MELNRRDLMVGAAALVAASSSDEASAQAPAPPSGKPNVIEMLRKMRSVVSTGAQLVLVDLWTDPTHTQPAAAPLLSGEFLVISGEGQAYSEVEADEWLGRTGWRKLERKPLAGPGSVIVAEAT